MPVINLPRDDRFGELGKGLGGLASGLAQGVQQQQVQAGVTQIMSDPSISEQDKPVQILKDHGDAGYQMYKNLLTSKAVQTGINDKLSEIGLRSVQTAAAQAKLDKEFPEQVAHIKAQNKLLGVDTAGKEALLPGLPAAQKAETELKTQEASRAEVQAGLGAASLPKVKIENELAKIQLDQLKGTLDEAGAATSLDNTLKASGIDPASSLGNMAKAAYRMEPDIKKKGDAFIKVISGQAQAEGRAAIPAEAPTDVRKQTTNAVEAATSMDRFLSSFRTGGAEKIGNIGDILKGENPAALKVWLERHGFATGDENLLNMWNSSIQNVQSVATSGGGFFAEGRVRLAKDVTPSISETPLHSIIAADQVADRQIAALENQKLNLAPKQSKAGIDDALTKWRNVKAVTGTLNSYVTNPGKPDERTVMMFDGNQIDPKSFKKLVEGSKTYEFKGANMSGATLIEEARKRNVAPDVFRDQLKKYYESAR